jgi:hypothetical protein
VHIKNEKESTLRERERERERDVGVMASHLGLWEGEGIRVLALLAKNKGFGVYRRRRRTSLK